MNTVAYERWELRHDTLMGRVRALEAVGQDAALQLSLQERASLATIIHQLRAEARRVLRTKRVDA